MRSLTSLTNYYGSLSTNTDPINLTLGKTMINDAHRYLIEKYYDNERSMTIQSVAGQQAYTLPFNNFQIKDITVQVGGLLYTPPEILSRVDWDISNFIQFQSSYPFSYFIYNNQLLIFPVPSASNNPITFNYKIRVPDLVLDDVITGTVAVNANSNQVIGTGTSWQITTGINEFRWLNIPFPNGDNEWYQVANVSDSTHLTLVSPYSGLQNVTGAAYTLGQIPIIKEDFQDLLVYRPLVIYYESINKDSEKAEMYQNLWNLGIQRLDAIEGSKTTDVGLGGPNPIFNPNLFPYSIG